MDRLKNYNPLVQHNKQYPIKYCSVAFFLKVTHTRVSPTNFVVEYTIFVFSVSDWSTLQLRQMRGVLANANGLSLFYDISPHGPPLQDCSSQTSRIRIWSIANFFQSASQYFSLLFRFYIIRTS